MCICQNAREPIYRKIKEIKALVTINRLTTFALVLEIINFQIWIGFLIYYGSPIP